MSATRTFRKSLRRTAASAGVATMVLGAGVVTAAPASAYSVQGCGSPFKVATSIWPYIVQQQNCYINYNWCEEVFAKARDGYYKRYTWNLNTVTGARSNVRTFAPPNTRGCL